MNSLYERLLDFTGDGVYVYTFDEGRILRANRGLARILDVNLAPEEMAGKLMRDLISYVEEEGTIRSLLELKGEVHGYEYHFRTLKGEYRWVLHDSFMAEDSETGLRVVEAIVKDITAIKKYEHDLNESEKTYRSLVEHAGDGICIIQDGRIKMANKGLAKLTGHEIFAALDQPFVGYVHEGEIEKLSTLYERLLSGKDDTQTYETVLKHKNGRRIDVNINASAIEYKGTPAALALIRDVTKHKMAEKSARESERMKAMGTVAGAVANNFSNTLRVIRGNAAAIAENLIPNTAVHANAIRIMKSVDHAMDLTGRLLSVANQKSDDKAVQPTSVHLGRVVENTRELIETALSKQNVEIHIKSPDNMPFVLADLDSMVDVLVNLFMNAAEAMPKGGTITIDTIERRIIRPVVNPNSEGGVFVGLRIRDAGTGMNKEQLARLFEPFYTTKKGHSHFGLGLPAVNSIIRSWGGWVDVKTKLGAGTTFRLFLRKSEKPPELKPAVEETPRLTVLVVDDDPSDIAITKTALEKAQHVVLTATNGSDGAAVYVKNKGAIDLSIVDMIMPESGGTNLIAGILKANPQAALLITCGFSRDYARSLLPVSAWGFLQKPFDENQIIEAVNNTMKGSRRAD